MHRVCFSKERQEGEEEALLRKTRRFLENIREKPRRITESIDGQWFAANFPNTDRKATSAMQTATTALFAEKQRVILMSFNPFSC
jgi:hypothetical protein